VTAAGILLGEPAGLALAPAAGLAAIASAGWGLENNLVSVIDGFTPSQMALVKGLVAGSVNLALGLGLEGPPSSGRAVYAGLAIGVLGYGVSIVLHVAGSQKIGAARGQVLFSTAPFVGMTASWIALREPIESVQVGAALLMGAGIAVFLSGRHIHHHAHEAMAHTHDHVHGDGHHDHAHEGEGRSGRHTHPHEHVPHEHEHPHDPDLHHRHEHGRARPASP
jgi:drug/metabolite transporter (DMT)-like permease